MYSPLNGIALAIIAKAGTQSFSEAGASWYISNEQAMKFPTRVMFIREPIERLVSCYSFFTTLRDENTSFSDIPESAIINWESFVDYILKNKNAHWMPQSDSVLYSGEITPTHIYRFDDVNKWWPKFFPSILSVENKSVKKIVDTKYRIKDLEKYYAADFELYKSCKKYKEGDGWPLP